MQLQPQTKGKKSVASSCAQQSGLRRILNLARVTSGSPSSVGNLSRSSAPLDANDNPSRSSGSLLRRFTSKSARNTSAKICSVKLLPNFSPVTVTMFGYSLASVPTVSHPRQVSYAINRSPSMLVSCAGRCCCRDCELVFHFLPTFLIFCCLDPFIVVSFNVAYLIFRSFRSEEVIDFIFPSFLWSSHSSVCFVFRAEFRVPSCCFHYPSFFR